MFKDIDKLRKSLIVAFLTTILLCIQFVLYLSPLDESSAFMSFGVYAYYITAAVGHAALLVFIAWLLTYLPMQIFSFTRKLSLPLFVVACFLLNVLIYADRMVFGIYKFHINSFVLNMLLGEGAGQVFIVTTGMILQVVALISFLLVIYIALVYLSLRFAKHRSLGIVKKLTVLTLFVFCFSNLFHAYADASAKYPGVLLVSEKIPYFYPLTAKKQLNKLGVVNVYDAGQSDNGTLLGILNYPKNRLELEKDFQNKNIVYLIVDAWNPRVFNAEVMPRTYEFSKRCSVFENHLSSASLTQGGIFGLFFGLSPNYWKPADLSASRPVFLDQLQKENYNIKLFPSASLLNPPFHRVVFRGVENARIETPGETPFDRDIQITNDFKFFLDEREARADSSRFFSFVFYDLLHANNIPAEHRTKFTPSWDYPDYMKLSNDTDPEPFFNLYKNCGIYLDSLIGNLLDDIESRGLLENTIIVITGDHSEEFNENKKNYWGHGSNFSKAQIRVPMMYYNSDREHSTYRHKTTHYDISPTVLKEGIGVTNPPSDFSMGQSLFDNNRDSIHIVMSARRLAFVTDHLIFERKWGYFNVTDSVLNPIPNFSIDPAFMKRALELENMFMK